MTMMMDAVIQDLKASPGEWKVIYEKVSSGMDSRYRKAGAEVIMEAIPGEKRMRKMRARWPLNGSAPKPSEQRPLAIVLYNASLASRGLPQIENWESIAQSVRFEFDAIAEAATIHLAVKP